jgi:hypothetical protein
VEDAVLRTRGAAPFAALIALAARALAALFFGDLTALVGCHLLLLLSFYDLPWERVTIHRAAHIREAHDADHAIVEGSDEQSAGTGRPRSSRRYRRMLSDHVVNSLLVRHVSIQLWLLDGAYHKKVAISQAEQHALITSITRK